MFVVSENILVRKHEVRNIFSSHDCNYVYQVQYSSQIKWICRRITDSSKTYKSKETYKQTKSLKNTHTNKHEKQTDKQTNNKKPLTGNNICRHFLILLAWYEILKCYFSSNNHNYSILIFNLFNKIAPVPQSLLKYENYQCIAIIHMT